MIKAGVLSEKIVPKRSNTDMQSADWYYSTLAHYEILVTKVFKGREKIEKLLGIVNSTDGFHTHKRFKLKIYTAKSDGLCGVNLRKGQKYLLSGYIYSGKMNIGLCNWIKPFKELTKMEHRGIRGNFDCTCSTAVCWGDFRSCPQSKNKCYWNPNEHSSCTAKHKLCKRSKGRCAWRDDGLFNKCMKRSSQLP